MAFKSHIWLSKTTYGFYQIYLINGSLTGFENEKFGFQNPNLVFKNQIWKPYLQLENRILKTVCVFWNTHLVFVKNTCLVFENRIWFYVKNHICVLKHTCALWNPILICVQNTNTAFKTRICFLKHTCVSQCLNVFL